MPADLRSFYEAEARELIDRLTRGTATLAGAPEAERRTLADIQRAAHTLKGAAHVVGERGMAALAHGFEDAVALYRAQPGNDAAAGLLRLADGLSAELSGHAPTVAEPAPLAATPRAAELAPNAPAPAVPAARQPEPEAVRIAAASTLRVDAAEAGRLLDQVSGTGALVERMRGTLSRLEALESIGDAEVRRLQRADLRRTLADDLHRLERGLRDLYGTAQHLQLGEAQALLLDAGRTVRATAAAQGKQVQCVTSGGSERVDSRILEALGDALLHLLRNAVAHGIEPPQERLLAGKPPAGTIEVAIERRGADLLLLCADDGRGIPLDAVRQAAVRRGELSPEAAADAGEQELLNLLLRPGFSLRDGVDSVSGRGVGLDAVREAVERVGGRIAIRTVPGQGAAFTLTVPSTIAALLALEVSAGGTRYLLPAGAVEHTLRMEPHHTAQVQGMRSLRVGPESMSFLRLQDVVPERGHGHPPPGSAPTLVRSSALILKAGERRFALGVDRVEGLSSMLLRPLPASAGAVPFIAGASLGANGVPILMLDPAGLAEAAALHHSRAGSASLPRPSPILPVLVIDDSLTTRMLEQSILQAEGYEVDLAVSAEQGLEKARARPYGLFLVDVEMPGMNGFDFVRTTRADPDLRKTPAILVTSLDSAEHRERGRLAGASGYIVKGEFNQGIYLDRIRRTLSGTGGTV